MTLLQKMFQAMHNDFDSCVKFYFLIVYLRVFVTT